MSNKHNKIVHPPKKQHLPSILSITHKYPPSMGGMQKQAYKLISGIEKTYPVKKISSIPITCTFHGLDVVFANKIYQRLLVSRMKKLDNIVAVSRATAEECKKRGASEENIAIIPNGVDKDMRNIRKDPLFKERLAEPSKLKKTAESFQLYTLQNYSGERMTEAYRRLFSLLLHSKQKPQQSVSPVK